MNRTRVYISGMGVVCPLGQNVPETLQSLREGRSALGRLTRFTPASHDPLPVGEAPVVPDPAIPLTHLVARLAADQALPPSEEPPDAVVVGVTTGGMAVTETLLREDCRDPDAFCRHAVGTIATDLARRCRCTGPALTVSTACSSGAAALAIALALIRTGRARRVLAGGADSICQLTYYGFKSLQLIDGEGSRPLDRDRKGMSVAEGAGMLLLEAGPPSQASLQLLGAGLSCDAFHPAKPHPAGKGAMAAMRAAVEDAGLAIDQIDYISLHGTGTPDNDRSEAEAIRRLFGEPHPLLSSIKGATGHSLGGSGAVEAVVAAIAVREGLVPANTGLRTLDPELGIAPVLQPLDRPIRTVLSNSFGFGGNNAAILIGKTEARSEPSDHGGAGPLTAIRWAAVTGAGRTGKTLERMRDGRDCRGSSPETLLQKGLSPKVTRRARRLALMAMTLAAEASGPTERYSTPGAVFFGTGWGAMSETHEFLNALWESDEKYASPTDFIGSVHNAPAGQIAFLTGAEGPNITMSGGDYSFEQALMAAELLAPANTTTLLLGADEAHERLSRLLDPSTAEGISSDGGAAFILSRNPDDKGPSIALRHYETGVEQAPDPGRLVDSLGGPEAVRGRFDRLLVGIPAAFRQVAEAQLQRFRELSGYSGPILDYRKLTGEFASASAVAAVLAADMVDGGRSGLNSAQAGCSNDPPRAVLVVGLGTSITAVEVACR
ncbi:MAG: beta-ketoacyl synthase N-terminal-like domain-containing protein [Desulfobacterales bacterium]